MPAKRLIFLRYIIYGFLWLCRPFVSIVLCQVRVDRTGHLAGNNESFLRRQALLKQDRKIYIGIVSPRAPIANQQLLTMLKRKMIIVRSQFWFRAITSKPLKNSPFLPRSLFYLSIVH